MTDRVKKFPVKINITLQNQSCHVAFVYLLKHERLQDLVNDNRQFLPVYFTTDQNSYLNYECVLVNKQAIVYISEYTQHKLFQKDKSVD